MLNHIHKYKFDSDITRGHPHSLTGYSGHLLGINIYHFHFFYGICSYNDHTHYFSGVTGKPIKTENGHIHKMEGILELSNEHKHEFTGYTSEEISYISGGAYGDAYI